MLSTKKILILVEESIGRQRCKEPVTIGMPFPQGRVFDRQNLKLCKENKDIAFQIKILNRWFDGSLKWILLDFQADCPANETVEYFLWYDRLKISSPPPPRKVAPPFIVDTGKVKFICSTEFFCPFTNIFINNISSIEPSESEMILTDEYGHKMTPKVEKMDIEHSGPLQTTIKFRGNFYEKNNKVFAEFDSRLHFYTDKSLIRGEFTIRNPRKAIHKGGFWDLGDKGSVYIRDLSLHIGLPHSETGCIYWKSDLSQQKKVCKEKSVIIYQDSSGGENWRSKNHFNRLGDIPLRFKGYQVHSANQLIEEGERSNPTVMISTGKQGILASISHFWQNFPQALEAAENQIILRFYPKQAQDMMELQGGEQKTYRFILGFGTEESLVEEISSLQFPLSVHTTAEIYAHSGALGYLTLYGKEKHSLYREFVDAGLKGPRNFFKKREVIDEYGWRHFGCVWGDHESVKEIKTNQEALISHYNNQYDLMNGFLLQFARSGDIRWFELAEDLAYHKIDIDIYHTHEDKTAYNGGLFWHTDHYRPVGRGTHRTYSKDALNGQDPKHYGGGPSNEHNYTTGLMNFYFFTGNEQAKETVIGLAEWVFGMDHWTQNLLRKLKGCKTSLATKTVSENYQGPGRGAGNSINALLDAYILTTNKKYLKKAESLIRRCIHPTEDISKNELDKPEYRWSYLVFLQVLGKYLDLKSEWGQLDENFNYTRSSLEHYAKWMLKNEKPYTQQKEKILIWTETWPAHDVRKSCVFDYAGMYSKEPLRSKFLERAEFFYQTALDDLGKFDTRDFTRPLAVLMHYGVMHDQFQTQNLNNQRPFLAE